MATGETNQLGNESGSVNAQDTLPQDGPWNMDPVKLSQSLGNSVAPQSAANGGADVPDVSAPWNLKGEDLAKITRNSFPPIKAAPLSDPSIPKTDLTNFDALFGRLINAETGGKHFGPDGQLITSAKNAKGITQVIPATGDRPGFGVQPIQNDSVDEYIRFGKDYLKAMINYFGGDQSKGVAAYNAGPGSVQNAVLKATQAGRPDAWAQYLPKPSETLPYLKKIVGGYYG